MRVSECPVCDSYGLAFWAAKNRRGRTYRLDRCSNCGFAFVNPRPDCDELASHYSESFASREEVDVEVLREREAAWPSQTWEACRLFDRIEQLLVKRGPGRPAMLDVGAGYGFFSREAHARGIDPVLLDVSEKNLAIASDLVEAPLANCSFEAFSTDRLFDIILMSQSLEHAVDVNLWVSKAFRLLRTGGVLALAVPNFGSMVRRVTGTSDPFVMPPEHLNYFDAATVRMLLARHGFECATVDTWSRISPGTLQRRLAGLPAGTIRSLCFLVNGVLSMGDRLNMGMQLNVYAIKGGVTDAGY